MPCVTLLSDFGTADGYAGAMKGVLSSLCPEARLVDITHDIAAGDIRGGAFALATAARTFPVGTVHLAVVDPGVGTERRGLAIYAGGSFYVGPDNGLLSLAAEAPRQIFELDRPQWFLSPVSATFHGRDVFAPIAARIAAGRALEDLGTLVAGMIEIAFPQPRREGSGLCGEVFHVDRFGNLVTTIHERDLPPESRSLQVKIGGLVLSLHATYGRAAPGDLIALIGSSGLVEIAKVNGSAEEFLGEAAARPGAAVRIEVAGI